MSALLRFIGVASVGCAVLSSASCESPTVPPRDEAYSFVFEGLGERLIYRWPDGEKIGVYVVPTTVSERAGVLEAAFRHTARVWNEASLYGEYEIVSSSLREADVVLAWANEPLPLDTSECPPFPSGAAWTTFCSDDAFEEIEAYPLLEGEHAQDGVHMIVQVLPSPTNIQIADALVAHEFGHVLGIGIHPCDLNDAGCSRRVGAFESLMFAGVPTQSTPSAADRETIEMLYHTEPDLTP